MYDLCENVVLVDHASIHTRILFLPKTISFSCLLLVLEELCKGTSKFDSNMFVKKIFREQMGTWKNPW